MHSVIHVALVTQILEMVYIKISLVKLHATSLKMRLWLSSSRHELAARHKIAASNLLKIIPSLKHITCVLNRQWSRSSQ